MSENPIEKVKVLAESAPPSVGISAAWNYGNTMFVIVLGLLLTPYQLGKLGVEFYGVIMLEMALLSIATLINTSLVKTMVVMAGGKDALSWTDGDKIAKYASFVVCAAGAFAAWLILPGLNIPAGGLTQARWLMVAFCVSQSFSIIVATSQARLMLCQRFDLLNKALIAGQVVQCVVIVALFELFRPSLVLHGLAVLAAAATSRFLIWRYMTTYIS
ncbi:MAG: hypothetical protein F9K30_17265, partial [Dechloromonas sp.]